MSVHTPKSKKRSAAKFPSQHKEPTLFLDRNLGRHVIADRLRAEGMAVEVHDDHLAQDAPDDEWISLAGQSRWVVITKDKHIRHRAAELEAVKAHSARVMVIRVKNATAEDIADVLVNGRHRISRFAAKTRAPFVAGIDRYGKVTAYRLSDPVAEHITDTTPAPS